jgi:hypothetical protein
MNNHSKEEVVRYTGNFCSFIMYFLFALVLYSPSTEQFNIIITYCTLQINVKHAQHNIMHNQYSFEICTTIKYHFKSTERCETLKGGNVEVITFQSAAYMFHIRIVCIIKIEYPYIQYPFSLIRNILYKKNLQNSNIVIFTTKEIFPCTSTQHQTKNITICYGNTNRKVE